MLAITKIILISLFAFQVVQAQWGNSGTHYNDAFGRGSSGFGASSPLGSIGAGNSFGGGRRDFDQFSGFGSGIGHGHRGFYRRLDEESSQVQTLRDGEINDVASIRLEGKIGVHFDVVPESEAAVMYTQHGVLTVTPGEGDKIYGAGESSAGPWIVHLMHPTKLETISHQFVEGAGVQGGLYVDDGITILYTDNKGIMHTLESNEAKLKITKNGDALKIKFRGDLKSRIVPEEVIETAKGSIVAENIPEEVVGTVEGVSGVSENVEGSTIRALHKKKGYTYAAPLYYPMYQPLQYVRPATYVPQYRPLTSSCCPSSYIRESACFSYC